MRILRGAIRNGLGDAKNWSLDEIRKTTQRPNLIAGTLNVHLNEAHIVRRDFTLHANRRTDGRNEDLYFEECRLLLGSCKVPALIARTSTNYHGEKVLEIMAAEHIRDGYGLSDGHIIDVQVRTEDDETFA